MQEIPGFGLIRSDNPLVAEVLATVARDLYPEGRVDETLAHDVEGAKQAVESSELFQSIGGYELAQEFARELGDGVNPMEILMTGPAWVYANLMVGISIGIALAQRAATGPQIQ